MDMSSVNQTDDSGLTSEGKLQAELQGDDRLIHFFLGEEGECFYSGVFKQGVTFEWVKNKVAESLQAQYQDLSMYIGKKRIPEPFCLIDMDVQNDCEIIVQLAEGALRGVALREKILQEMAMEDEGFGGDTGGPDVNDSDSDN